MRRAELAVDCKAVEARLRGRPHYQLTTELILALQVEQGIQSLAAQGDSKPAVVA